MLSAMGTAVLIAMAAAVAEAVTSHALHHLTNSDRGLGGAEGPEGFGQFAHEEIRPSFRLDRQPPLLGVRCFDQDFLLIERNAEDVRRGDPKHIQQI